jgi:hypothetical protein
MRYSSLMTLAFSLFLALLMTSPANASDPKRIQPDGVAMRDARQATHRYAECLEQPIFARSTVLLRRFAPHHPRFLAVRKRLQNYACTEIGAVHVPSEILQGYLFETVYLKMRSRDDVVKLTSAPPFDYTILYGDPANPQSAQAIGMAEFGDCVVRRNPAVAYDLAAVLPASQKEADLFNDLRPDFEACIESGNNIAFARSELRAAMATAFYHMSGLRDD